MKERGAIRLRTTIGLTLMVLASGLAAQTTATHGATPPLAHAHVAMPSSPASGFQNEMDVGMARMMQDMHSPGYSGNVDIDFLRMMIPHHAGAVDMARLLLKHGRDPATRQLAEEIIAGQTIEIESMTRRLALLRQTSLQKNGAEFPALGGTRGN